MTSSGDRLRAWSTERRDRRRDRAHLSRTHDRLLGLLSAEDLIGVADLDELRRRVEGRTGRSIELLGTPLPGGTLHGVLVTTATTDYIAFDPERPAAHRDHVILHELAHIICGHTTEGGTPVAELDTARATAAASGETPTRALARHGYADEQEMEAEVLASLLGQRVEQVASAGAPLPLPLRRLGAGGDRSWP